MKRLRVIAMAACREELLGQLQRLGCVEIREPETAGEDWSGLLERESSRLAEAKGALAEVNTALAAMAVELPGGGALMVGNFINAILNFLIMAFAVFCLVKALNRLHRKKEETPAPPPAPSQEELLLTEIRDLLKERT